VSKIQKMALINSGITALYIVAIATFMNWVSKTMSHKPDNFLDPIALLMLFVFSAAFTSFFMFGRPALMYLDGKKKEAISLVIYTFGFFFAYTVVALILLISLPR